METILKVLVGSQAHGLATSESDFDYRGVFVVPTKEILSLGSKHTTTQWIEGKEDDTSWELGHFLHLATKCNPTILEVFLAPWKEFPIDESVDLSKEEVLGLELQDLFPQVWNSTAVMNAFIGYGHNQMKKFLDDKDVRPAKYAAAYARTLYNAWELLTTGTFTIRVVDTPVGGTIRRFKEGNYSGYGEVIDHCRKWEKNVREAYKQNPNKQTNMEAVNEFLLKVRKLYW